MTDQGVVAGLYVSPVGVEMWRELERPARLAVGTVVERNSDSWCDVV